MGMNTRLLRPTPSGFDPRRIAGNNLWLDFSDNATLTLDGNGLVQQINDKSGAGNNGAQATGANRPALGSINGLQAGDWGTNTNSKTLTLSKAGVNWQEFFAACVSDEAGTTFGIFTGLFCSTDAIGLISTGGSDFTATFGSFYDTVLMNNAGTINRIIMPALKTPSVVGAHHVNAMNVNGFTVGSDRAIASRGWRGRIGEVVCYSRRLSAAERLKVYEWLKAKWKM
jgi:hypothetical protein